MRLFELAGIANSYVVIFNLRKACDWSRRDDVTRDTLALSRHAIFGTRGQKIFTDVKN